MPHKPGIGAIFGIVSEDGVAKPNFPVNLYDRTNGQHVTRQITDANGGFVFNGLNPDTNDYQVVAQDEDNPPYKNAIIRDRIQPVYGYQGATYGGNWRWLALQKQCQAYYDGSVRRDGFACSPYPCGLGNPYFCPSQSGVNQAPTFATSITPGAPDIPALDMRGGKIGFGPMVQVSPSNMATLINQNPTECSFEFAADLSTCYAQGTTNGYICFLAGYDYYSYNWMATGNRDYTSLFLIRYYPDSKVIRLWRNNGANGDGDLETGLVEITTSPYIDMTPYLNGPHHFAFTMRYGDSAKFYVDGVVVATISLTSTNAHPVYFNDGNYGWLAYVVAGSDMVSQGGNQLFYLFGGMNGHIALLALYSRMLSDSDVQQLYQAAMTNTTPVLTGYAKDVFIDRPSFYARLNDPMGTAVVKDITRPGTFYDGAPAGGVTFGNQTILAGGTGALFNGAGGIRFSYSGFVQLEPKGYSIEWIGKPTAATPAATESLYVSTDTNESRAYVQLQRLTNGRLCLIHSASGAETLTFASTMSDTAKEHHFCITVDKDARLATLYVDGVQVEQIATNTTLLDVPGGATANQWEGHVGGVVSDSSAISQGFSGLLHDVALYQSILTPGRIQSHYNAISVP